MIALRQFDIGVWPLKGWRLTWTIKGAPQNSVIHIERADGPAGPWTRIASDLPPNTIHYEDELGARAMWNRHYWRLILFDNTADEVVLESIPYTWDAGVDRIVAEVIRTHELRLIPFNGKYNGWTRLFAVYRRQTFGDYCTTCVNPVTGKSFLDKCPVCLGSRYLQGWTIPVLLPGYFLTPFQRSTVNGSYGKSQEMRNMLRTSTRVMLDPEDFLAERHSGRVWRVAQLTTTQPGDNLTTQTAEVEMVERDRIEAQLTFQESLLNG